MSFKDNDNNSYAMAAGTTLAPGAYLVIDETEFGFGLGPRDGLGLFAPDGTRIGDGFGWTGHAAFGFSRCPNGTGNLTDTPTSKGAPNNCD